MKLDGPSLLKRFGKAKSARSNWETLWDEIYEYCLPAREGFYASVPGEERANVIYDMTALNATAEFSSRLQSGMTPPFQPWFRFEAGYEVVGKDAKALNRELVAVSSAVWEVLSNSNFFTESQELVTDLAVGWGTQIIEDGRDSNLVNFKTVPQAHTYWDCGPFGYVDGVFRVRQNVPIKDLEVMFKGAKLSEELQRKLAGDEKATTHLVEACYRDWTTRSVERYYYQIVANEDKSLIVDDTFTGIGSRPFVTPRWNVAAGETYGRGPLVNALPAIRTVNLVQELVLMNGQMAIAGIWQIDDDGTLNIDNIEIVPGAVYTRAADSRGLERTDPGGRFDVSDLIIANLQADIKMALLAENLGSLERTPRSATEVQARLQNIAEQIGGAYGRLQSEWITPMLQRVVYLLKRQGRLEIPKIDGREVRVVQKSPLARAQRFEEVERIRGFAADLINILGPQIGMAKINSETLGDELVKNWEVNPELLRDENELKEMLSNTAEAVGSMGEEQGAPLQAVNG